MPHVDKEKRRAYQREWNRLHGAECSRRYYLSHTLTRREEGLRQQRQRRESGKQLLEWFKARPCMDCGGWFPPECMDFDHRDDKDKEFGIGPRVGARLDRLFAEIAKCDIVCANCHRIRSRMRGQIGRKGEAMADTRGAQDIANGFIRLSPEDVGDSYAHSPQGADSRGPMENWRTVSGVEPQQTDVGERTHHEDTGSYEGHVRPKETYNHRFGKSGANEPPKHGRTGGSEVEKVTDLGHRASAKGSVGGGSNY